MARAPRLLFHPEDEVGWGEVGFFGVLLDVVTGFVEVGFVAEKAIPVSCLPEGAFAFAKLVDSVGGDTFPRLHEHFERGFQEAEKDVDVVRHDDETVDLVELLVIVQEAVGDDLRGVAIAEEAGSHALIEPAFHFAGEGFVVFAFGFIVPRFEVFFEPGLAVGFPLDDEFLGGRSRRAAR